MKVINARVLLDRGIRALDYLVPKRLLDRARIGWRVRVLSEEGLALGIVVGIARRESTEDPTNVGIIKAILGDRPVLNAKSFELARWLSAYYCCTIEQVVRCIVPPAIIPNKSKGKMRRYSSIAWHASPRGVEKLQTEVDKHANSNLELKTAQTAAASSIEKELVASKPTRPILLHSIDGSEKMEIYLKVIRASLLLGKKAIVLVPEMSLTPYLAHRFKCFLGEDESTIAVLHSRLSRTEQKYEWCKILSGDAHIVIGGRGAVFAPLNNLGLIIVDDEHESSFKQHEALRYHARDVAVARGKLERCVVILGSATPSLESYFNAMRGKYRRLDLFQRGSDCPKTQVQIIDMRRELEDVNLQRIISRRLFAAMQSCLERNEQTILFLNRRGFFSKVSCGTCGTEQDCPNCSAALTLHRSAGCLRCHLCAHETSALDKCPACGGRSIYYGGFGTEKVESVVRALFPQAVVARLDADSMVRKDAYRNTLRALRRGEIDIAIGTQMVAEAIRCPNIGLLGILCADLDLDLPDFRAGERTFQVLMRLTNLATRKRTPSVILVQGYAPFVDCIQSWRLYDFRRFYNNEMKFRKRWDFPPFQHAIIIDIHSAHQGRAKLTAETIARHLREILPRQFLLSASVPAPVERLRGKFHFHILLRGKAIMLLTRLIRYALDNLPIPEDVLVSVDVDAIQLL